MVAKNTQTRLGHFFHIWANKATHFLCFNLFCHISSTSDLSEQGQFFTFFKFFFFRLFSRWAAPNNPLLQVSTNKKSTKKWQKNEFPMEASMWFYIVKSKQSKKTCFLGGLFDYFLQNGKSGLFSQRFRKKLLQSKGQKSALQTK